MTSVVQKSDQVAHVHRFPSFDVISFFRFSYSPFFCILISVSYILSWLFVVVAVVVVAVILTSNQKTDFEPPPTPSLHNKK